MLQHYYGWLPDKKDVRDFAYIPSIISLPQEVDLRPSCSPVRDQGQLGACTAFALATGLREWMIGSRVMLSPMFLYWQERYIEGTVNEDSGARIRDGLRALSKMGVCPEIDDPYISANFTHTPTAQAVHDAVPYTITSYHRIHTLIGIRSALAEGLPVVMGMSVYESFESEDVAKTGIVPLPKRGEQLMGGHAVFIVGYKQDSSYPGGGYLIVKNSWGTSWGNNGYFYLPWKYISLSRTPDLWVAK
jgi:C1A family cysteine protease